MVLASYSLLTRPFADAMAQEARAVVDLDKGSWCGAGSGTFFVSYVFELTAVVGITWMSSVATWSSPTCSPSSPSLTTRSFFAVEPFAFFVAPVDDGFVSVAPAVDGFGLCSYGGQDDLAAVTKALNTLDKK